MEIRILQYLEGARAAEGITVIIDVFRAFSLEAYLFSRGAAGILAVGREETARRLKALHPEHYLCGERGGRVLPGFDFGNSPSQSAAFSMEGRNVIHTTSAGTQGFAAAAGASELLTGSLVNAAATAAYITSRKPEIVSLVAMGLDGVSPADEDTLCAAYLKSLLLGRPLDMERELRLLRGKPQSEKFFDPLTQDVFPEADYHMCARADIFPFALAVKRDGADIFAVSRVF